MSNFWVKRKCLVCKKSFFARRDHIKMGYGIFCGRSCACKWKRMKGIMVGVKKGFKHTAKSKEKMRMGNLNKHLSPTTEFKVGHRPWNWMGGRISFIKSIKLLPKYKQWRNQVFERDNYTCQKCGKRGGELHPHHIVSFSKILSNFLEEYPNLSLPNDRKILIKLVKSYEPFWDVSNGQTLCEDCHKKTKSWGEWGEKCQEAKF